MSEPVTLYRAKNRGAEGAGIPVAWQVVDDVRDWGGVSDTISADGDAWMYRACEVYRMGDGETSAWSVWASVDGTPKALPVPSLMGHVDWFSVWEAEGVRTTEFVRALALVVHCTHTVRVVEAILLAVICHVPKTDEAPRVGLFAVKARLVSDVDAYVEESERQTAAALEAADADRMSRAGYFVDSARNVDDPFYKQRVVARAVRFALLLLGEPNDDNIADLARNASEWASLAADGGASLLEVARNAIAPDVVFTHLVERERSRASGFSEPGPFSVTPTRRLGR